MAMLFITGLKERGKPYVNLYTGQNTNPMKTGSY